MLGQGLYLKNTARQGVFNYVHVFSPRATNNLNLGWFQTLSETARPRVRRSQHK